MNAQQVYRKLEEAGYERRRSQMLFMEAIWDFLTSDKKILMIEAPTGTGKTFGYLIPLLLSGRRIIVSTHTKVLEHQLMDDVKRIMEIFGLERKVGLLKGVSSYVCKQKLHLAKEELIEGNWEEVQEEARKCNGDLMEINLPPSVVQPFVVTSREECGSCNLHDCYYITARDRALDAEVLITNHHIIAQMPAVIKEADIVVFDEAHELPDTLVSAQSVDFTERTIREYVDVEKIDEDDLPEIYGLLKKEVYPSEVSRAVREVTKVTSAVSISRDVATQVQAVLGIAVDRDRILDEPSAADDKVIKILRRIVTLRNLLFKMKRYLEDLPGYVRYSEETKSGKRFIRAPLFPELFRLTGQTKTILVSATLERTFMELVLSLDPDDYSYTSIPPEWEYDFKVRVYDVRPQDGEWSKTLEQAVRDARQEYDKVMVLVTNVEHLKYVDADLVQGSAPLTRLIKTFKSRGGVLAGADVFWKGIDVPGNKAIVMSKLPFPNASDPVHQERCRFLDENYGEKIRWEYVTSWALMKLKQGIGRLKRSKNDTGTVYLVDNRIFNPFFRKFYHVLSRYGKVEKVSPLLHKSLACLSVSASLLSSFFLF